MTQQQIDAVITGQVNTIANNKLQPLMIRIAEEQGKISVAQKNIAELQKSVVQVEQEIQELNKNLQAAFGSTGE